MAGYPFNTALVTGASSGIGEALVRLLAAAGVSTVVVARRADRLEGLAGALPGIEALPADLLTDGGVEAVAARLADRARPIDLLVNNAGFGHAGPFASASEEVSVEQIDLNVRALVQLTHAALPGMIERGAGWILNVSSIGGFQAFPGSAVYGATKAFVTSFTEAIHEELRGSGVRATALCPGLTRTEFVDVSGFGGEADRIPGIAWLSAEQVAREGLADVVRNRALSIPGAQYKAAFAASLVPRSVARAVAGRFRLA